MKNKLKIYTDGACSTELRLGGWAVVYKFENEDVFCETGHATNTTNNQMELYAFYKALKFIYNSVSDCEIEIYSDSAYVVNAVKLGWLKKWSKNGWMLSSGDGKIKNVKLWKAILNILSYLEEYCFDYGCMSLKIEKVKGHNGDELNEMADKLATSEVKKLKAKNE